MNRLRRVLEDPRTEATLDVLVVLWLQRNLIRVVRESFTSRKG